MKQLKLSEQIWIVTEMDFRFSFRKQIGNQEMVKLYQERCGREFGKEG